MRTNRLIIKLLFCIAACAAGVSGQTSGANARVAAALEPGDNGSKDKPADGGGSVLPSNPVGYAGNTECKTCHPTIWSDFYKNPHFKSMASGKATPELTGCEGCHGPAKAHIAAGGGRNTIEHAFTVMKPAEIVATCLKCHAKDYNRANIRHSEHTDHDVACTACHSNHHPVSNKNLLAKSQPDVCYECHADVQSQFDLPSKHRVNEGFMQCSDCHNPHGGFTTSFGMGQASKMLNVSHGNDQPCLKCHVEKRGPFVFEHETGETEGCIGCHKPHGSTNAKLLTRPAVAQLCLECHTGNGDFGGRSNRGVTYQDHATHSMIDPHYQRCTSCHVAIHGSNVHYRFLR